MSEDNIIIHIEKLLRKLTKCNSQYKLYKLLLEKTNDDLDELNLASAFFLMVIDLIF